MLRKLWLGALLLWAWGSVEATHIVGAELYYECIDPASHRYRLTLKMYRDCFLGQAPFDDPIVLFVFDGSQNIRLQTINIPKPASTPRILPRNWDACVGGPYTICVEEGIYTTVVTLPPRATGYNLGWARCCRNSAITNLTVPLQEGATFLAHIPDSALAACNSMPVFNNQPPIFLCANRPFNFDHSATDTDGDSLVYRLVNPYTGVDLFNRGAANNQVNPGNPPPVVNLGNPMQGPPYRTVQFATGYSFSDPFGSGNFVINPRTGFLSVIPNQTGIFVLAVSVFEYRNGQLLSENRRDFQIHVITCRPPDDPPIITHDLSGFQRQNDTVYVPADSAFCIPVAVRDSNLADTLNAFTVSAAFGNGTFPLPTATFNFTGINPLNGQMCWKPSCNLTGQTIPLVIGAEDINECPNIDDVFDTVWVKIFLPKNRPPNLQSDLSGLTTRGDTLVVQANDSFCYPFVLTDPDGDLLSILPASPIFFRPGGPIIQTNGGGRRITGQVCWTPDCSYEGQVIPLGLRSVDQGKCSQSFPVNDTVWLVVEAPPNAPPAIRTDLSQLNTVGDTVLIRAGDRFCFPFTVNDPNLGDSLVARLTGAMFGGPDPPQVSITGVNPLRGTLCWTPDCRYLDQTLPIVLAAEDKVDCSNQGFAFDTVWVRIFLEPNAPPAIQTDLGTLRQVGDSIFIVAREAFCFDFEIRDPNPNDSLTAFPISPAFFAPGGPQLSWTPGNPLRGRVCWTPDCAVAGQRVPLIFGGGDNVRCNRDFTVRDTVWVVVELPPNNAPLATHDLSNLPRVVGDTIYADANERFCYRIDVFDLDPGDSLTIQPLSPIFATATPPTLSVSGTNPVVITVCWEPDCSYEGALIPLIIGAEDDAECNNQKQAFDTVWVKVSDPLTLPPIIVPNLSNVNSRGDTILVNLGDSMCFDFLVLDQTFDNGMTAQYFFEDLNGNNLGYGSLSLRQNQDTIFGRVCWRPGCFNGGSLYRLRIVGIDSETCPPFKTAEKLLYVKVNTSFRSWAGADVGFCEGTGGAQITGTPVGGRGPYTYRWGCTAPQCGLSGPFDPNPTVNPATSTTFYVQITDADGCTSEIDSVFVEVYETPIVDAGPDQFLCENSGGTNLQGRVVNAEVVPQPYQWRWTPTSGLITPNRPNTFANPDTTTIYTLEVTAANGCTSRATTLDTLSTVVIHRVPRPVVEAGPNLDICRGDSVNLAGFARGTFPPYRFEWTPATGIADPFDPQSKVSPPHTFTYFVVAYDRDCPSLADSVRVTVHTLPTAEPGPTRRICWGDSTQLPGLGGGDVRGSDYTYRWTPTRGLSDPTAAQPWAAPDTETTYRVTARSVYGCGSVDYATTVQVAPTPQAIAAPDTFVCRGDSVQLRGSFVWRGEVPHRNNVFYTWAEAEGLRDRFIASPKAAPSQTTLYYLTTNYNDCRATDSVKVDVFNAIDNLALTASDTAVCRGDTVRLTAYGGAGAARYHWSGAPVGDPTAATQRVRPQTDSRYTVEISEGPCRATGSISVRLKPTPTGRYVLAARSGCAPLRVRGSVQDPEAVGVVWQLGDEPPQNTAELDVTLAEAGVYPLTYTAVGREGCTVTVRRDTIRVGSPVAAAFEADPAPIGGVATLGLPDARVQLTDRSQFAVAWLWDFGDGSLSAEASPVHVYDRPGDYRIRLVATGAGGCRDTVSLGTFRVPAPELFVPNLFTPNGDRANDRFTVLYSGSEPLQLRVFDRWGRLYYDDPAADWDGLTPRGEDAAPGVYYYVLEVGAKVYKGNVTLLR